LLPLSLQPVANHDLLFDPPVESLRGQSYWRGRGFTVRFAVEVLREDRPARRFPERALDLPHGRAAITELDLDGARLRLEFQVGTKGGLDYAVEVSACTDPVVEGRRRGGDVRRFSSVFRARAQGGLRRRDAVVELPIPLPDGPATARVRACLDLHGFVHPSLILEKDRYRQDEFIGLRLLRSTCGRGLPRRSPLTIEEARDWERDSCVEVLLSGSLPLCSRRRGAISFVRERAYLAGHGAELGPSDGEPVPGSVPVGLTLRFRPTEGAPVLEWHYAVLERLSPVSLDPGDGSGHVTVHRPFVLPAWDTLSLAEGVTLVPLARLSDGSVLVLRAWRKPLEDG
jgi:hypothetical protein